MAEPLRPTEAADRTGDPQLRVWWRILRVILLGLAYLVAARTSLSEGLAFQAYLFWPAAAVAHAAFFILGAEAFWGLALGSLVLNLTGWLPWPQGLAMAAFQTLGPFLAWRLLVRLGLPRPDLRQTRDLLLWLEVSAGASAIFSAILGTVVVGSALREGGFRDPLTTGLSWFLGDLTAILCLGPFLLLFLGPRPTADREGPAPSRSAHPLLEGLALGSACLLLLFGARINPGLSPDVGLALQFALVLPALWLALRFGPRSTAAGVVLLSLAVLALLWSRGPALPEEAFRFSQLHLLVLALAALVTSTGAEEARRARLALEARELQAHRMEAVSTLAGGLVHGFNNQLTVLLGNLDRLRLSLPPSSGFEGTPALDRMEEAAQTMEQTVRQLKALSQQAPLRAFSLPLSQALAPFLDEVRALPDRIRFELQLQEDPLVGLDPELLRQALRLLLANSVEALPSGGRVRLLAQREAPWVRLVLEDDGPGMAPEVLSRACDPFYTTRTGGRNRGLGLSIAFSLAKQMGGWLSLSSSPGRGTRAELGLPLGRPLEPSGVPTTPGLRTRRVLLADDEAGIRELTREVLEGLDFEVVEAADGQEALDTFESDPLGWDLAILDLVMPRLHGTDVLARIQHLRPELPVLLISGYSSAARPDLLQGDHRRFLAKPFRIRELVGALGALGLTVPDPDEPRGR